MNTVTDLITSIESLSDDQIGRVANSLADQYRKAGDLRDLRVLLENPDPRLVSLGAWIFSECGDSNSAYDLKNLLVQLLDNTDSGVRLEAVRALAQFASTDAAVMSRMIRMLSDDNDAVRHVAALNLCLFPDESFNSRGDEIHGNMFRKGISKEQIIRIASSETTYDQCAAFVATLRNFGDDYDFVSAVCDILPSTITKHLSVLPRNRRF